MGKKIIVFDFDKTLTYSDTIFGFFIAVSFKNILFPFKVIGYFIAMIFAKFRIISNTDLKVCGIYLFLKNMNEKQLSIRALKYSNKIKLNKLYENYSFTSKDTIFVISASFIDYLKPLFPDNVFVIGSQLLYKENKVYGLKDNCFKNRKAQILLANGVNSIDVVYTDSKSDLALVEMSKKTILVKGDTYITCNGEKEFLNFF